ncbi:hypothetical protein [Rubrobacter calidifluminis]|uniref:hypothetical protein n=1 Tax=Rubrobacter calidifluminis TaxID=1392640 RepID=UPI00236082D0|nr:hypothetical protein [Rubrobacter calidifluminis]
MALIRTILVLVILVILLHLGASFVGVSPSTNGFTRAIYGLGAILESPAGALLNALPLSEGGRSLVQKNPFYASALAAVIGYFILYLLLGVGRGK